MNEIWQMLMSESALWVPRVGGAIVVIAVFYFLLKLINLAITKVTIRLKIDEHLASLFRRASRITLVVFAVVTVLGTLGINVTALVAGLGLTGFALGFALKDTISNLLSGVLILLYQPFKIGDTIIIAGFEGRVVTIDLRYTELNQGQNKVLIPNSKLFTDPITVKAAESMPETTGLADEVILEDN